MSDRAPSPSSTATDNRNRVRQPLVFGGLSGGRGMGAGAHHPARPRPLPRRPRAAARGVPRRAPGRRDRQLRPGRRAVPRRRRVRLGLGAGRLDPRLGGPARVDHGRAPRRDRRPPPCPARPAGRLPERPVPALRAGQPQAPAAEHEHDPPAPARSRRPRSAGLRVGPQGGQPVRRDQGRSVRRLPRHPAVEVGARPRAATPTGARRPTPSTSSRRRSRPSSPSTSAGPARRSSRPTWARAWRPCGATPRRSPRSTGCATCSRSTAARTRPRSCCRTPREAPDEIMGEAEQTLLSHALTAACAPDPTARPRPAGRPAQRARLGDLVPHDLGRADEDPAVVRPQHIGAEHERLRRPGRAGAQDPPRRTRRLRKGPLPSPSHAQGMPGGGRAGRSDRSAAPGFQAVADRDAVPQLLPSPTAASSIDGRGARSSRRFGCFRGSAGNRPSTGPSSSRSADIHHVTARTGSLRSAGAGLSGTGAQAPRVAGGRR